MPRRPRLHLDAVPRHIVQRGHNPQPCFFAEEDYHAYLHWLGWALKREGALLHAYALMTNHVHLLVTPERGESVARIMIAWGGATCSTSTPATGAAESFGTAATSPP
jgi:putative transposase